MTYNNKSNNNLLDFLKSNEGQGTLLYGASAIASIANSLVDYNLFKTQNSFNKVQANQIELQAQQQINQLREQFNNQIGNTQYKTATRGIKVKENRAMELSAKNLGEDIHTLKTNTKMKADNLRTQARINNKMAKSSLISNIGSTLGSLGTNLYNLNTLK